MAVAEATGVPRGTRAPELETLAVTDRGGVGVLTLNRPEHSNAMSPAMLRELPVATAWLADQAPFRGLVVTGAGDAFCAGGDVGALREILDDPDADIAADCRVRIDQLHQAILNLQRIPYPVVAAVNGLAAGSGFSLALACDDRVAAARAAFTAAYGRLGLSPDGGMTYFLPRLIGEVRARTLLLEDAVVRADRALADGWVSEVVAPDEVVDAARRRAVRLARSAPYYVAATKRLLGRAFHSTLAEHLQLERHSFADASATGDFRRGLEAFSAGRRPRFEGD